MKTVEDLEKNYCTIAKALLNNGKSEVINLESLVCNEVLIICSASYFLLLRLLKRFEDRCNTVNISVILREDNIGQIKSSRNLQRVFCLKNGVDFSIGAISTYKKELMEIEFDTVIGMYNNRNGIGYSNLEDILSSIKGDPTYRYNCYDELLRIDDTILHKENNLAISALAELFDRSI